MLAVIMAVILIVFFLFAAFAVVFSFCYVIGQWRAKRRLQRELDHTERMRKVNLV